MTAADVDAGMPSRDQSQGDADLFLAAKQMFGIVQLERETEDGGNRPERDVALFPGQADAQDFAPFMKPLADDAEIRNRARIGTGIRSCQRKARHFQAFRKARQVMILLCVGAVMKQQFGGSEGIRHHDRYAGGRTARGQFLHHLRMGIS